MSPRDLNLILKGVGNGSPPKSYETRKVNTHSSHTKFTVISDLHMGHKCYRPDILDHAIKNSRMQKSEFFCIPGDILEGMSGREGHIYELDKIGATEQLDYGVEQLSKIDKPIFAITATNSHDGWFSSKNNMGFEVGPELERRIENFNFLGYDEADLELESGLKIRLLHPGGGTAYAVCFDDKTEIFTENGWKLFKDLKFYEKVATLNKESNDLEWELPHAWTNQKYKGKMIEFNGKGFDLVVTPNHRMWVKRPWGIKWKFIEAKEITNGRQWKVNRIIKNWKGFDEKYFNIELPLPKPKKKGKLQNYVRKIKPELWFKFMGWFLSEGNIGHASKCVEISQSKTKNTSKYDEICKLISDMGFTYYCSENKIKITSLQMYNYFKNFGHSHQKKIPNTMKRANKRLLFLLLETLFKGDGCFRKNGNMQNYTTNSKQLADDIQEIAMKCKIACSIKKYENIKSNFNQTKPIYQLNLAYRDTTPTITKKPKIINYDGTIHCVSTKNGVLLVRRNGKACWSGNSYKLQKYLNAISGGKKPHILLQGHFHKAEYLFYRNTHGFDAGTLCEQTNFMRKKQTPAHLGYWIVDAWMDKEKKGVDRLRPEFVPFYE